MESFQLYVGLDCGGDSHHACVLSETGALISDRVVAADAEGLAAFADWLLTLMAEYAPSRVAIAVEHPRGAVVETLLERRFALFAINPKQVDRFRDRYTVSGAKDDHRDAWVLAHALITDLAAYRRIRPDDPAIVQVRALTRLDGDLGDQLRQTANRLREQLLRYYPVLLTWCAGADEPWLWQLLAMAPTPAEGARCSRAMLERLLTRARIRRVTASELAAALARPPLRVTAGTVTAATMHLQILLPQLQLLHRQRRDVLRQLRRRLTVLAAEPAGDGREHPDVTILLSLPGVGVRIGATMLAEAAHALQARDYHGLRLLAGAAPVTRASGKRRVVLMRYACNQRLRQACYHWGRGAIQRDPVARRHYRVLRSAGHSHARAIRGVTDRLLAVLIGMLRSGTLYDHARRHIA